MNSAPRPRAPSGACSSSPGQPSKRVPCSSRWSDPMRVRLLIIAATFVGTARATPSRGQATPPSTDIYLAPLRQQGGRWLVGAPVNITNRPGYDNQPSFTPDSRSVLFTSVRGDGQADIYRYDRRTRSTSRLTNTPESEYSATV